MSTPQNTLTYEGILEMFREIGRKQEETARQMQETKLMFQETDRKFQETDRKFQETAEQLKATQKEIGKLGSRVGEIVENMVAGNIVAQFQELGYDVSSRSENKVFGKKGTSDSGEIDLLLEDGNVAILIEAKTSLKIDDVRAHLERMEKYRRHIDSSGSGEKRRYIGAVAGTVVADNVIQFAHESGLYVIVQSVRTVEILPQPKGFVAKEW